MSSCGPMGSCLLTPPGALAPSPSCHRRREGGFSHSHPKVEVFTSPPCPDLIPAESGFISVLHASLVMGGRGYAVRYEITLLLASQALLGITVLSLSLVISSSPYLVLRGCAPQWESVFHCSSHLLYHPFQPLESLTLPRPNVLVLSASHLPASSNPWVEHLRPTSRVFLM